jgi:hypothetical protein
MSAARAADAHPPETDKADNATTNPRPHEAQLTLIARNPVDASIVEAGTAILEVHGLALYRSE